MSSDRSYDFTPSENWSSGQWRDLTSHEPEHSNWNRRQPMFPRPQPPPRDIPQDHGRVVHDRLLPRPYAVPYQAQPRRRPPHPPVQVLVDHDPFDSTHPWLTQNQPTNRDESKLRPDEQKAALNKLKKEIYNPVQTRVARQVSLYFRGLNNNNTTGETVKDKNEDGKRCAICLEDFVPKEIVTVTPCAHMFHEDCIIPWVTSNGSCPVCRFAIYEGTKQNTDSSARANVNTMPHGVMVDRDLVSIMRAFDGTFQLDDIRSVLLPRLTRG